MNKTIIMAIVVIILGAIGYITINNNNHKAMSDEMRDGEVMLDTMDDNMGKGDSMMDENEVTMTDKMGEEKMKDDSSTSKIFNISGTKFAFDVKEIRAKKGDTITINFKSADGLHDWVVDEFKASTNRVQTGEQTSVTFVADKVGTYEYYCSVGNHRAAGMVGKLIVE